MDPSTKSTTKIAALKLVQRFASISLPAGFSVGEFLAASKEAFIAAAIEDLEKRAIRPTTSRIAVMTGLTRAEVSRIREGTATLPAAVSEPRTERVMHAWFTNPDYLDEAGNPKVLPEFGQESFEELVRNHSGDMTRRALLEELISGGMASREPNGRIRAIRRHHYTEIASLDPLNVLETQLQVLTDDPASINCHTITVEFPNTPSPAISKTVSQRTERFLSALSDYLHTEAKKQSTKIVGDRTKYRLSISHGKST